MIAGVHILSFGRRGRLPAGAWLSGLTRARGPPVAAVGVRTPATLSQLDRRLTRYVIYRGCNQKMGRGPPSQTSSFA